MLVFDNSGSMRANDPQRLAEAATMLYVQLAKKGDQVGLVVFDDRARVAVPLGSRRSRHRRFSKNLARLRLDGRTTNIGHALETALSALGRPKPGVSDVVVLLTDGKVDLGARNRERLVRETKRIRTEVVDRYRARQVPLYTIAFTPDADRALLGELAGRTQGSFRYIQSPDDLHRAFSELFVMASSSSSLPVRAGAVVVDSSVNQTAFVLSKARPGDRNHVVAPDEEVLTAQNVRSGMKWKSSASYDLVEMNKPQPGAWQMLEKDGKPASAVAVIQDSALELEVSFMPKEPTVHDVMEFRVELLEGGKRIRNFTRLKSMAVDAVVEGPGPKRRTVVFESGDEAGLFVGEVRNPEPGHYGIVVAAMSPALQRQWRGSYMVLPTCFEHRVRTNERTPVAMVRLTEDCPKYKDLTALSARHLDGGALEWRRMERNKAGVFYQRIEPLGPGEKGVVRLKVTATTKNGYAVNFEPEPFRLTEPDVDAWMAVVGQRLAVINVPLFILVGIGLFARRAMKREKELYDD